MIAVHGSVKSGFEAVRDAFARNFKSDFEVGASVAVMHKGEMVVDIWAGHTDLDRTQPWNEDTVINVWSTTKTQMFLCVLILADDGAQEPRPCHSPRTLAKTWQRGHQD